MIFDALYESAQRGELLCVDGGVCHWHLRRDGQLTIREILVVPEQQRRGIGRMMLERLKQTPGAQCIVAKCPAHLPSNGWYKRRGFVLADKETTRGGKPINIWRLELCAN